MEKKYETINTNKFPVEVDMQFKRQILPDNSLVLTRYKDGASTQPILKQTGKTFGGTLIYDLRITPPKEVVEAVILVCRKSTNHYCVSGFTNKFTKIEHLKSSQEVGEFIKRWFCRTLLDD